MTRSRWAFVLLASTAVSGAAGITATARADDHAVDEATRTRARALGEQGNDLFDKGDYQGALEMYDRAAALVNVPTLGLKAARCLDKLGRLIEASERYLAVTRTTLPPDALDVHREAVTSAETEREALLPRIPSVVVTVAGTAATVTLDGKPYPSALFDVKSPIDPGKHHVELHASEGDDAQDFSVAEGETRPVKLAPHGHKAPPAYAPPARSWMSPVHGVGIAALALGVAGLAAGAATTAVLASKKSELEGPCGADLGACPDGVDIDGYNALRLPSTAAWIAGGVLATAGIVMIAIPNPGARSSTTTALHLSPAGATFTATF